MEKTIICNNKPVTISWEKVVNIKDENAMVLESGLTKLSPYKRRVEKIIIHWDVCPSSESCFKYMKRAGDVSTHFSIDNDGTVYQFADTCHKAWHAVGNNSTSIGIDLSTAYDIKFQDKYIKKYGAPKPVIDSAIVHNEQLKPFLGFYDSQIEALEQLIISLTKYYKIPLRYPKDSDGNYLLTNSETINRFKGIMCHFHCSRNKIDVAGLKLDEIILNLRKKFAENKEIIEQ